MAYNSKILEKVLKQIINNNNLSEQKDIQIKLKENNIHIPQSTLSRWLKKLNIVKVNNIYKLLNYSLLTENSVVKSIKISPPNLILVQTSPGHAGMIAHRIDNNINIDNPELDILGTVAGDDSILIVADAGKDLEDIKAKLHELLIKNTY